jgi:pyridoxal 5'-phosphate synthase pdxS subunit
MADIFWLERDKLNDGMAKMLKGGVIMDVSSASEAKIAQQAGACAVMALDMIPSRIRKQGGIARMSQVALIEEIQRVVDIPVMAKCRIGHTVEARILQELKIDFIDESEVLTPVDTDHIDKREFKVPFVCGAMSLGQALRRIEEGAIMIRTKGEAGTGDVSHAVRHWKEIKSEINNLKSYFDLNKYTKVEQEQVFDKYCSDEHVNKYLLYNTLKLGRLPVVTFAAGGIATPADAALMMELGVDGIFIGSGIFESSQPENMAKSICMATTNFNDCEKIVEACKISSTPMKGIEC